MNESRFHSMSERNYSLPAQIPIQADRFKYLVNEYQPKDTDKWVMFHHPNEHALDDVSGQTLPKHYGRFVIYSIDTECCVLDVTYFMLRESIPEDDNDLAAVIVEIKVNEDRSQFCVPDGNDLNGYARDLLIQLIEND